MSTTSIQPAASSYRTRIGGSRVPGAWVARAARWLAVDPRDVLGFTAGPARDQDGRPEGLTGALDIWRGRIARRRALAVARRYLALAAALTTLSALLSRLVAGTTPWWALALPCAVALGAALVALGRTLPLETVARLLDRELSLHEQIASAFEVSNSHARAANGPLNALLERRALMTLSEAQRAWRPRLVPARGEWLAIALLVLATAALLLAPRPASVPSASAVRQRPAVVATAQPLSRVALTAPPPSMQAHLPVQMNAAVVSTPAARAGTAHSSASGRKPGQSQHLLSTRTHGAAPTPRAAGGGSGSTAKGGKASGQGGGRLPGAPDAPRLPQQGSASSGGKQGSSLSVYKGNNRRLQPAAPGAAPGHPGGASGAPGAQAPGGASKAGATARAGQNPRSGANAAGAQQTSYTCILNPQSCTNQQGAQALPYGGGFHLTPSQLPKPGLIVGKGSFQGKGTPGGSSAGHEQGSTSGQSAAHLPALNSKGRQFNLQSGYGGAQGTRSGKPAPGQSASGSGQATATGEGAPGLQVIDYVPADANQVAPTNRAIVTSYFVARAAQQ